jgi:PKD domain-containing protein
MRTLVAVACLAFLTMSLAGCSDQERYPNGANASSSSGSASPTATTSRSTTGSQTASGSSSSSSSGPSGGSDANHPPSAGLTAAPVNGSAPLNVTFSLSGSDADSDPLNWTLSFGDGNSTNGTSLPATVVHQYSLAGNFSVVLRVGDGRGGQSSANATVQVIGGAPAAPDLHCHRSGTAAGPLYQYSGDGGDWVFVEDNGIAGLQVANNHAGGGPFHNPAWVDCVDGDMQVF